MSQNIKFMEMYDLLYKYGRSDWGCKGYYRHQLIKHIDRDWGFFRKMLPKFMEISTSKSFITSELLKHYENKFTKEDLGVMIEKFEKHMLERDVSRTLNMMKELRNSINKKIMDILEKDLKDNDEKIKNMIIEYL